MTTTTPLSLALPPSLSLEGRVALVTGASRGIGRSIALTLAARGADLAVNDFVRPDGTGAAELEAVCAEVRALGRRALPVAFDVSDAAAAERGIAAATEGLGELHILVNNAGISIDNLLLRASEAEFVRTLEINLKGAFVCCKAAVRPLLKAKDKGRIINIASVVGEQGNAGQVSYSASKAGLIGLTKSLAKELAGRGVTVNAVAPGFIETAMTAAALKGEAREALIRQIPLSRVGSAEDVAEAVAYLATPAASYLTGHVLRVNGGLFM